MSNFAREPVTIVEIECKRCSLTYGSSPCTAAIGTTGTYKCYNTLATCQDTPNYTETTVPLKFIKQGQTSAVTDYLIPSVQDVGTTPTRINPGGRAGTDKPLGRRESVSISFIDHPHSDNFVDDYVTERPWNPFERGTFWSKWLTRNPYYKNWTINVYDGYKDDALAAMAKRQYLIDKIDGPDSRGNVRLTALDVLRLADDKKAQCPQLSTGKLLSGITNSATSLVVTGGVSTDYDNSSYIRIGDEVIGFASYTVGGGGDITFNSCTRGQLGTTAEAHDADDQVQGCVQFTSATPWSVVETLLKDFAGVPASYIPTADWATEGTTWLTGFNVSRVITEPVGVSQLIGELSEQCSFYIWWDSAAQEIKLKALHPAIGTIPKITENGDLVQNMTSISVKPEMRVSEVWVSYDPYNPTLDANKRASYRQTLVRVNDNPYNERQVYEIYSQWIGSTVASDMAARLSSRYVNPPKYISFALDAGRASLAVADVFDIEYRGFTDATGLLTPQRYQVISKQDMPAGEVVKYEAMKFDYGTDIRPGRWMVNTTTNTYDTATEAEKLNGMFWADDDGTLFGGDAGYTWS